MRYLCAALVAVGSGQRQLPAVTLALERRALTAHTLLVNTVSVGGVRPAAEDKAAVLAVLAAVWQQS